MGVRNQAFIRPCWAWLVVNGLKRKRRTESVLCPIKSLQVRILPHPLITLNQRRSVRYENKIFKENGGR